MTASELQLGRESSKNTPTLRGSSGELARKVGFTIYAELRLVYVVVGKKLSAEKLKGYAAAIRADPRFDPNFSELVDLTDVEEITITPADALNLADEIDPYSIRAKRAFVTRTSMQMHVARMHQLLQADKSNIEIFSSVAEARNWIKADTSSTADEDAEPKAVTARTRPRREACER
jgi:hypothetical protein